jgi:hypothetical protein
MIIGDRHSGIMVIVGAGIPIVAIILLFVAISRFIFPENVRSTERGLANGA